VAESSAILVERGTVSGVGRTVQAVQVWAEHTEVRDSDERPSVTLKRRD